MNLILQVNTDTDSGEVFATPLGYTATDGIGILNKTSAAMELTEVNLDQASGNEEAYGDYLAKLTGLSREGFTVTLYVQDIQDLDVYS